MFPNPMFMSVMLPSLNILNLLADLFDLGFEVNDRVISEFWHFEPVVLASD